MNQASRTVFQNNELLRHLDVASIDRIAAVASRRHYDHGATIFAIGDSADAIYGVISGQVQISARTRTHEEIFLTTYGSGRIFGLIAGIDGLPRCANARAAPTTEVFAICRDYFLRLIAATPLLSMSLVTLFCQSQRSATRLIVEEYAQRSVPARLAHRVLELTEPETNSRNGSDTALEITQSDLAKFVFASRQVVNHHLGEWDRHGWISMSRGHLSVVDRQALLAMATNGVADI
jgi:CRP/FNR family cyclic AMP-dependent transcriptional regulator